MISMGSAPTKARNWTALGWSHRRKNQPMALRDHKSGRDQLRRLGEQPAQWMVTVRAIQKGDQSRRIDVALSLCGRRRDRRWIGWNVDLHSPPDRRISSTDFGRQPEALP